MLHVGLDLSRKRVDSIVGPVPGLPAGGCGALADVAAIPGVTARWRGRPRHDADYGGWSQAATTIAPACRNEATNVRM